MPIARSRAAGLRWRYVSPEFLELLRRARSPFPTQRAFAEALGLKLQRVNAALQGKGYPFNVEHSLHLARLGNFPPLVVLRAAGKHAEADLIERLFGSPELTSAERDLVARWRQLPASARPAILTLLDTLTPPAAPAPPRRRRRRTR